MAKSIVAVVGATASGKTALGIQIARAFNGEVVSCDSMQIYKGLDIGTAKPDSSELSAVVHHMIDIVPPTEEYSVERFCAQARECIDDIISRGKLPVLVGGTGLYTDNLIYGTSFSAPVRDEALTAELEAFAKENGNDELFKILEKEDPEKAKTLHPNDVKRVIRAIETVRTTGKTRAELDGESRPSESPYDCLWFMIDMDRDILYKRIDTRVDIMMKNGLVEETIREVYPKRDKMKTALQAIGYKEVMWYLDGLCTLEEATELLKRNTRRYAKRQLTWLRRNNSINRLLSDDAFNQAEKIIKERMYLH